MFTGPYFVNKDLKLSYRDVAWTNDYSVIFVDNPIGKFTLVFEKQNFKNRKKALTLLFTF